jgi:hypothetical protein
VLGHTARSQEGGQRREAAAEPSPAREARERTAGIEPATLSLGSQGSSAQPRGSISVRASLRASQQALFRFAPLAFAANGHPFKGLPL